MKKGWMVKESELDEDQIKILMSALDKSCIVSGCAGSGKSILALIKARRIQEERGEDYQIIVYTKALCRYMDSGKKELELSKPIHYHYYWSHKLKQPKSKYIIVDEIQDFNKEEILEFVNSADDGYFFFFGDTAQSIYQGLKENIVPVKGIRSILPDGKSAKIWELYYNYRLPIPVAKFVQVIGVDLPPFFQKTYRSRETEKPRMIRYENKKEQIKAIHRIITNNDLTDVAILLPQREMVKAAYDMLTEIGGNYELKYDDRNNIGNSRDNLDFGSTNPKIMTYHSAKGLQFETVFIPYAEDFTESSVSKQKALYVAMTRTYRNLYVMYSGWLPHPFSKINPGLYKSTETDTIEDI